MSSAVVSVAVTSAAVGNADIPGFPMAVVDVFQMRRLHQRGGVTHCFLTHGHSDHTVGLGPNWRAAGRVVTSSATAHYLRTVLGVPADRIRELNPGDPPLALGDGLVYAFDSGHCHGGLVFLFWAPALRRVYLHLGESRCGEGSPLLDAVWDRWQQERERIDTQERETVVWTVCGDPQARWGPEAGGGGGGCAGGGVVSGPLVPRIADRLWADIRRWSPPGPRGERLLCILATRRFDHAALWGALITRIETDISDCHHYADPDVLAAYTVGLDWAASSSPTSRTWRVPSDWSPPDASASSPLSVTLLLASDRDMGRTRWARRCRLGGCLEFLGPADRPAWFSVDFDRIVLVTGAHWQGRPRGCRLLDPPELGCYAVAECGYDHYLVADDGACGHATRADQEAFRIELANRLGRDGHGRVNVYSGWM